MSALHSAALEPDGCIEISDPLRLPEKPLVSVMISAYNHSRYLREAIEGVLMQETDFPVEIVIGEDCSTDDTMEIALSYQRAHPHLIRIITSERNVGMQANFKRLLQKSRGDILAICEGDDYWIDRKKLSEQVAILEKDKRATLSFHSCYCRLADSDALMGPYIARTGNATFTVEEVISGGGGFMPTASIVVRKSAVDRIPEEIIDASPVGDYLVQVYGSLSGGAVYIDKPMCVYRRGHPESWNSSLKDISNTIKFETLFSKTLLAMDADLKSFGNSFNEHIYRYYFSRLLRCHYNSDDRKVALYSSILISNSGRFGMVRRTLVRFSRARPLMLLLFCVRRGTEKLYEKVNLSSKQFLRNL